MEIKHLKEELAGRLEVETPRKLKVVFMPHFCLDNFLHVQEKPDTFFERMKGTAAHGGGNLAVPQRMGTGGKAANCASACASLGLKAYLIAQTDELGYTLLEQLVKDGGMDISHVGRSGNLAFTTTMELAGANVMLSDPGSLARFGPERLTEEDEKLIAEADFVCISDWGLNERATELARHVFKLVRNGGCGKTFFDPGDPSPKGEGSKESIEELVNEVISQGLVDVLSVNEDEAERYGGMKKLKKHSRVDLHTTDYSVSYYDDRKTEKVPSFNVQPLRLTGAGDAWNAGDILGEVMNLPHEKRLLLANAAAGYYISDPEGRHPTMAQLREFLGSN
ncbi:MAG: carbohydrate kinase family protein [Thermoplasmata archaeon]|nr:MAG: carbohydrate kinase family protein [Thermoplasmata archaeon]